MGLVFDMISIHALLTESDSIPWTSCRRLSDFNPRSPHGERRLPCQTRPGRTDFNPRSPHGERRWALPGSPFPREISIHALLTESDFSIALTSSALKYFNPRSPHGERLLIFFAGYFRVQISIHALLTESDCMPDIADCTRPISIHALLTESDSRFGSPTANLGNFNPRSPHGERRLSTSCFNFGVNISIHALLTESDNSALLLGKSQRLFQSTLSSRRATPGGGDQGGPARISIHALLTESDPPSFRCRGFLVVFQSTLSSRRATYCRSSRRRGPHYFNPRSPHGERLS